MKFRFILLFLLCFGRIFAIDFNVISAQHYSISSGLPQSYITDIHQDKNGYLWLSTLDGISKFNGYEFKNYYFDPFSANSLISNYSTEIQDYSDDGILISTFLGLSIYQAQSDQFFNIYLNSTDKKVGNILSAKVSQSKEIFVGTTSGLYQILITDTLKDILQFKLKKLFHQESKHLVFVGNKLFFSSANQVFELKNNKIVPVSYDFKHNISCLSVVNNRHLAIGAENIFIYIENINSDKVKSYEHIFTDPNLSINDIDLLNGKFWIATNSGLALMNSKAWYNNNFQTQWIKESQGSQNGISNNHVFNVVQDCFGVIWVGTKNGLDKIDSDKQKFSQTKRSSVFYNANLNNDTRCFYETKTHFFIGYANGISIKDKNSQFNLNLNSDFEVNDIQQINETVFLLATSAGLKKLIKTGENWKIKEYKNSKNKSINFLDIAGSKIVPISEFNYLIATVKGVVHLNIKNDSIFLWQENNVFDLKFNKNKIWAVSSAGVYELKTNTNNLKISTAKLVLDRFEQITPKCVFPDGDFLWIAYTGGGLVKYNLKLKSVQHFSTQDGLANNSVLGILKDNNGFLWMNTNSGVSKLNLKDNKFTNYSLKDGLQSIEFNQGAYFKDNTGKLYFGGLDGYNLIDPNLIVKNQNAPLIILSGAKVNGLSVWGNKKIHQLDLNNKPVFNLNHNQNSVTISVDGLHFSSPEENIYEYNLIGFQDEWIRVKNQREFYFPKLSPGKYVFNVRVASADGVWSSEIKTLYINISPPFWLNWWFIVLFVVLIVGIVFGIYFSRISIVKAQKKVLERKIKQRTREVEEQKAILEQQKAQLEIEKSKEEKLLFNLLPLNTAKELIQFGKSAPKNYRLATVMFADFKNFTKITENLRPNELVAELDDSFAHFDDIVGQFKVEKIKTSGDAYMCVGGVPGRNRTNPVDCVLAGLSFLKYIEEKKIRREGSGKPQWELRVGVHSGKLVAGVIGKKKFLYDVWGDTVNIASRMESTGDSGRINVSGTTYEYVKDYFECEYRGKLPVKNKGDIDMYYVNRIKPEFSEDKAGLLPNKKLFSVLEFNVYSDISYSKVKAYMLDRLQKELPENLYYHGVHHTLDVINAAERIAISENMDQEEIMIIKLAALFHDSGFLRKYRNNEPNGAELAKEILPNHGFTDQQVEVVQRLILATKIPQMPTDILEEILCDADLDYLGRDKEEFENISGTLKKELIEYGFLKSEDAWDPIQIEFLSKHRYFTKTAIMERQLNKMSRLEEIKERISNS